MVRVRAWLDHLGPGDLLPETLRGFSSWVVASLFIVVMLAALGLVPSIAAQTGVPFVTGLALFAPLPLLAAVDMLRRRTARDPRRAVTRALELAHIFLMGLYPALLVALSRFVGAAAFGALYIVTALFHAQLFRVSPRFPFWLLAFVAQAAISLGVRHDIAHVAVWAVLLPSTLSSALVAGNTKLHDDRQRAELLRTKIALAAQLLEIEARRGETLERELTEVLGVQHDAKSPLAAALLELDRLQRRLRPLDDAALMGSVEALRVSILSLRERLQGTRDRVAELQRRREPVDVAAVARAVVERSARAFPDVRIRGSDVEHAEALATAGASTLERILENLVQNACEGDGKARATEVHVAIEVCADDVAIHVCDNGPGFAPQMLARPIQTDSTTKPNGTGLGLFTAERLARASGGTLERRNAEGGGAVVTVRLAVELPALDR